MLRQYLILFFLSGFWFLTAVVGFDRIAFSDGDAVFTFSIFLAVLSAQGGVLLVLSVLSGLRIQKESAKSGRKNRRRGRKNLLSSVKNLLLRFLRGLSRISRALLKLYFPCMAMVNLLCFYLAFIPDISLLSVWQLVLILAGGGVVAFAFFEFVSALGRKAYALVALTGALAFLQCLVFWQTIKVYEASPEGETVSAEVRMVDFKHTPNIYLISWDALAPAAIVKKYFKTDVNYAQWMQDSGFRLFKNAFSDGWDTKSTFNRMAAMDPGYYRQIAKNRDGTDFDILMGNLPAPLWEIFNSNGYKIHISLLYGIECGPLVHACYGLQLPHMCVHSTGLVKSIGFFGYCKLVRNKSFMRLFDMEEYITGDDYLNKYSDLIVRRMSDALSDGGRHVFMSYMPMPGHVEYPFDYENPEQFQKYRGHFVGSDRSYLPSFMNYIFNSIRQHDSNPIILYFGDHGMGLSDKYAKEGASDAEHKFVVQDRFGITMGIYPKDVCRSYFDTPRLQEYANVSMVLHQLFSCLSEGDHPMPGFEGYGFYNEFYKYEHKGYTREEPGKFEDYLYE